ncbi:MAG: tRNA-dihydrouridine synthase, partial [Gammaproteobacteria bacterium]
LYTEMITTGALIHGPRERLLAFDPVEHPVAIQLGGSEPGELARCARMAERAGYDEVNLNVGCPSERVQRGAIGAGCEVFIVHARNAWLKGLSPRENREVPPLRYDVVARLARDFPDCRFVLNGGLRSHAEALGRLQDAGRPGALAGVMIGREAYENPWMLREVDPLYFGEPAPLRTREEAASAMCEHLRREAAANVPPRSVVRHMLGLFNGLPGARHWRRALSDSATLQAHAGNVIDAALAQAAAFRRART